MDVKINDFPGIGNRLKKYRLKAGFTAETLGSAVKEKFPNTGVSRQTIFNIENERRRMDMSSLIEIARTLDINPLSLLCDLGKPFEIVADDGPLAGLTPVGVCRLFGVNGYSLGAGMKTGTADAHELRLMSSAFDVIDKAATIKDGLDGKKLDPFGLLAWLYDVRTLRNNGAEPPEALGSLYKDVLDYVEHDDSVDGKTREMLRLQFERGGLGSAGE